MGKFIQRSLDGIKQEVQKVELEVSTPFYKLIETEVKPIATETIKYIEVPVEKIVTVTKEVIKQVDVEVVKYVDVIKEVIVEKVVQVPFETIKYVEKTVEKIIEVPVEKIREIEKQVVSIVHKIPYYYWMGLGIQTIIMLILLTKK